MAEKRPASTQMPSGDDPASCARQRKQGDVRIPPFAGRIGGNQEFVVSGDDEDTLKKQPDAAPIISIRDSLDPAGFLVLDTWRQAVVEGFGTCLLTFALGGASSALSESNKSPFANTLYAALANFIGLSLFIFSAAPMSGGHLNPTITLSTVFAGLCSVPRAVLYITAQGTGAIVGAYWLKLGLGTSYFSNSLIPGCTVDPGLVSVGELFALEYMFSQALIFIAFGVGLDPRQGKVFGPAFSPILVGLSLGFGTLTSSLIKAGYSGVSFNPARCLGLMTAKNELQYHWVHWVAPLCAALVNGFFYYFFPPYVKNKRRTAIC